MPWNVRSRPVSTSASTIETRKVGMISHFRIMIMSTGKIGTI